MIFDRKVARIRESASSEYRIYANPGRSDPWNIEGRERLMPEGDKEYEGQQTFLDVAATLAEQRRLSRFAYLAIKDR